MPLKSKTKSISLLALLLGMSLAGSKPSFAKMNSISTSEDLLVGGQKPAIFSGEAFALYVENDTRKIGGPGSDQAYSNGIKVSYIYAENRIPLWSRPVAHGLSFLAPDLETAKLNYAFSAGHQIYTPNNTQETTLIKDDRPYAGWLYLGFMVSLRQDKVEHFLELNLGTLGPSALGQEVQNTTHGMIGEKKALGWSNGLNDEPAIQLFYQKRFKKSLSDQIDFIPSYGAALGNVKVSAQIGALVRLGINLPDNFGPSRPSAGDSDPFVAPRKREFKNRESFYLFGGARGNLVGRNIFLDGNSFRESPRVTKYPMTFETEFGIGAELDTVSVVWRFVTKSPEFEERRIFNSFASVSLVYFVP